MTAIASADSTSTAGAGRYSGWSLGWLAWAAALIWLLYLVALPIGYMVIDGLTDEDGALTLANVAAFWSERRLVLAALNSLGVAAGVAVLSVLIGVPLAYGVARTTMKGKRLVQATIIISLVSPDFLLAMAYIALAGPNAGYLNVLLRASFGIREAGPLNIFSLWGLVFTALPHGVSFVFLTMVPALRNLDPALDEAARVQGASIRSTIFDITLPLMRPALLSGALLAFAGSLAMYGPPHMLRLNVLTISIREALLRLDFKAASVASLILILMSLVALAFYRRSTQQAERFRTMGGKSFNHRPFDLGAGTVVLTVFGAVYCLLALIVPYGAMLAVSLMKSVGEGFSAGNWTLQNYAVVFANPAVRSAARLSVTLAAVSATAVVVMGFLVAYLLVRSRAPGRAVLDYLSILPLAVPGTALGIALIVVYLNPPFNVLGFYGSFGILLVAYLTRFITFGVRTNQSTLVQLPPELEEASRVSGAGPLRTVFLITAPLMRHGLIYAWILVFILALPELSASVILKGLQTQTLSIVLLDIWNGNGGLASASAFGITMFVCVSSLLFIAAAIGKRAGFGFTG
ncbi:iron ABC transporter permease [Bosea sp. (in: a-proteobacteria)]|uniref:ABC transporter permease n=1 Tax=Bosea sp. (in: a-proteobacteria) TaxID=1871050 RepID=UPI0026216090|nr:iron ABC transporter permease [Bosea sp. (in: a-proteobacteria)]MCO5090371.1 iron ABC transporter permease [Bosea sp. (in: a-proteobacteria)]